MVRISWDKTLERFYDTGLDRGVLYPRVSNAVPWNGLVSVEESGAEEATPYYIDGRPFLNMPKPKEFTATIQAITYPDELSDLMGLAEVADGMYLDSQVGGIFDLSYRTLVGNAINGTDYAYKIHLVYNAVATPEAFSSQTLTDSSAPSEFAWQITTVPVNLPGFRPTAHIVIDTRHITQDKLQEIEVLLYGNDFDEDLIIDGGNPSDVHNDILDGGLLLGELTDVVDGGTASLVISWGSGLIEGGDPSSVSTEILDGGTAADPRTDPPGSLLDILIADGGAPIEGSASAVRALPHPGLIYDILSYTTGVVITDNGDDTWTAEGSYEDVYITSPGFFQINNVPTVDYGDGRYVISSTT